MVKVWSLVSLEQQQKTLNFLKKKKKVLATMVAHTFNSSSREAEAEVETGGSR